MLKLEEKLDRTLVRLATDGEIVTRTESPDPEPTDDGMKVIRFGPKHVVPQVDFAALERLESRGLARRVSDRYYGPDGARSVERFVPTELGESYAMVLRTREQVPA